MTTNTMNMISLGGYRFNANVNPFHAKNKSKSYIFSKRQKWQSTESLQFKGQKATSLTLDIKVIIEKESDLDILPALEKLGDDGKPLKLISVSEGGYMGLWVVTNYTEKGNIFTINGVALQQEAQITIEEFSE